MLCVEHLNVLGFDILQTVDDGALQFLDVFFVGDFSHGIPGKDGVVECIATQKALNPRWAWRHG